MCFSLGLSCKGLCASWTWLTISFPMLGKFSTIISSKIFSVSTFPFFFFLWEACNSNVGVFNIVPKVSEAILNSFHPFSFIVCFSSYFQHSIFQLIVHSSASIILLLVPSRILLISVIVLFISVCLFFISSMSSVIVITVTYFLCFLHSIFKSILTIIILNSFSGRLFISSLFIWSCEFLPFFF